jgi:glycogen(starch) synthase
MRIFFWTEMFWPYIGGIEVLSASLLTRLRTRGHDVVVVTSHLDGMELPDVERHLGVEVHRFHFREPFSRKDPVGLVRVRKQLADLKSSFAPDLVHLHFSGPSAYYHLATAEVRACPCLVTIHTWLAEPAANRDTLAAKVLERADWVTAVSQNVLDNVRRLAASVTPHSSVIYNGLEAPPLSPAPLPWSPPVLLCMGRLLEKKGFDLALQAYARLRSGYPDLRLVIAGDGPARSDLERLALELVGSQGIEFAGWVSPTDVPRLLNRATIVLVPSRWDEPFCLVALEAALMERPVIATRVGGLIEVVTDGRTGLLVTRDDAEGMANGIKSLLDQPEAARQLGRTARRMAHERFSLDRAADAYDSLYRQMAGNPA